MADVLLDDSGDLPADPEIVEDFRITIQKIEARLGLHQGEWAADTTKGFPWLEWFREKPPPVNEMVSVIPTELEAIDGVEEIRGFGGDFDPDTGVVTFTGTILGSDDEEADIDLTVDPTAPNASPTVAITKLSINRV